MSRRTPTSAQARRAGVGLRIAALAVAVGIASAASPADAQEAIRTTADAGPAAPNGEAGLLAAYGLDLATIERVDDAALLWRAVRELVLAERVAVATQQRILRRLWAIDPDIRSGSAVESATN